MEFLELKVKMRKDTGNGPARVLRREGSIPAIIYGPQAENIKLSVNARELENTIKDSPTRQVMLDLVIEDDQENRRKVMLKELQRHPVSGDPLHADFYQFSEDRPIKVNVPVTVTGTSIGVERGGVLQLIRRELEIFCLPLDIPQSIEIDITDLDIGDAKHVFDLTLDEKIRVTAKVNFTVVTVLSPKREKVVEEEEEEGGEEEAEESAETAEA